MFSALPRRLKVFTHKPLRLAGEADGAHWQEQGECALAQRGVNRQQAVGHRSPVTPEDTGVR